MCSSLTFLFVLKHPVYQVGLGLFLFSTWDSFWFWHWCLYGCACMQLYCLKSSAFNRDVKKRHDLLFYFSVRISYFGRWCLVFPPEHSLMYQAAEIDKSRLDWTLSSSSEVTKATDTGLVWWAGKEDELGGGEEGRGLSDLFWWGFLYVSEGLTVSAVRAEITQVSFKWKREENCVLAEKMVSLICQLNT